MKNIFFALALVLTAGSWPARVVASAQRMPFAADH